MLYEYLCNTCGNEKEIKHSIKDNPTIICEICGCMMLRKISGGLTVQFHGVGFYVNDYKKGKKE
jgi:putative FmdB family regulatory protein